MLLRQSRQAGSKLRKPDGTPRGLSEFGRSLGLVFLGVPDAPGRIRNLVDGATYTQSGTVPFVTGALGPGLNSGAKTNYIDVTCPAFSTNYVMGGVGMITPGGGSHTSCPFTDDDPFPSARKYQVQLQPLADAVQIGFDTAGNAYFATMTGIMPTLNAANGVVQVAVWEGAAMRLGLNGRIVTGTISNTPATPNTTQRLLAYKGSGAGSTNQWFSGAANMIFIAQRAWSVGEMQQVMADPWSLLDFGARPNWSVAAGGGFTGVAAQTLTLPTNSTAGKVTHVGAVAQTLIIVTQAAAGKREHIGSAAQTLSLPTQEALGANSKSGTTAQTLNLPTNAAAGKVGHVAAAAQILTLPTNATSGIVGHVGTAAQTLLLPTQNAYGPGGSGSPPADGITVLLRRRRRA